MPYENIKLFLTRSECFYCECIRWVLKKQSKPSNGMYCLFHSLTPIVFKKQQIPHVDNTSNRVSLLVEYDCIISDRAAENKKAPPILFNLILIQINSI